MGKGNKMDSNEQMVELTYDDVLENIVNTVWWNDKVDIRNFLKHDSNTKIRWFGLKDGDEFVAYTGVDPNAEIDFDGKALPAYGGCYVWAKSGYRYGVKLIEKVVDLFSKNRGEQVAYQFVVDPTMRVSLVANYLRNFNERNGWMILPVKNEFWESVLFVKMFKNNH